MQTIYFVTTNKGKIKNAQDALKPFGIKVKAVPIELVESREEDPLDIAKDKAKQAYKILKHPCIVEDSGFFIESLNGFPKTHIKFGLRTIGVDGILKLLKGVKNRKAEWRMSVVLALSSKKVKTFIFIEPGVIAEKPRPIKRTMMSDLWRIYVPTAIPNKKALSEMTDADLSAWEEYYRQNNQFAQLGEWLSKQK